MKTCNSTTLGCKESINPTSLTPLRISLKAAWELDHCTSMTLDYRRLSTTTPFSSLLVSPCSSVTQLLNGMKTGLLLNHGPTHLSSATRLLTPSSRMVLTLVIFSMKKATASPLNSQRKRLLLLTASSQLSMKVSRTLVLSDCEHALFKL